MQGLWGVCPCTGPVTINSQAKVLRGVSAADRVHTNVGGRTMRRKLESDYDLRRFVGGDGGGGGDDGGGDASSGGGCSAAEGGCSANGPSGGGVGGTIGSSIGGFIGFDIGGVLGGVIGAIAGGITGETLGNNFGDATTAAGNADLNGGGISGGN